MRDDFVKLETNFGTTDYVNPRKIACIRKSTKDNKFIVELFFDMGDTQYELLTEEDADRMIQKLTYNGSKEYFEL